MKGDKISSALSFRRREGKEEEEGRANSPAKRSSRRTPFGWEFVRFREYSGEAREDE